MSQRKFSRAWNEEFAVLKEMQDDRMLMHNNYTCHDRCVSHYMTNTFVLTEHSCMQNCLSKLAQAAVVTNIVFGRFEEMEAARPKKKG